MSPKPVAILTIFSKELAVLVESCIAKILESRNLNRKNNITWQQPISEIGPNGLSWFIRYKLKNEIIGEELLNLYSIAKHIFWPNIL